MSKIKKLKVNKDAKVHVDSIAKVVPIAMGTTEEVIDPIADPIAEIIVETPKPKDKKLIGDQWIIGLAKPLKEGKEYFVSADVATILISKSIAKLKK